MGKRVERLIAVVIVALALCAVAGRADRRIEEMQRRHNHD